MARNRGKVIDRKEWNGMGSAQETISTVATTVLGSLSFAIPATILRIRGSVYVFFDATQQAGDLMRCTFGIAKVSTDALTLGATALPDPAGDIDFPWMWWAQITLNSTVAADVSSYGQSNQIIEVDSKAMRRIKPNESLVMVVETANAVGAPVTILGNTQLRVLVGT